MSEHREEHLDLCAGAALGNLDANDRATLEAHLAAGCSVCETALAEFSSAVSLLAATAPAIEPPAGLRDRVLRAAREAAPVSAPVTPADAPRVATAPVTPADAARVPTVSASPTADRSRPAWPERDRRGRGSTGWMWGWGAAAACLAFALWSWTAASRLRSELQTQQARITQLEQARNDLEERLASEKRWVSVLTAADARVTELAPTADGDPAVHARAILDIGSHRAVVAFSNLRTPAGRDYQLWAIRDGKPSSLGLVRADDSGEAMLQLDLDPANLQALAVSLEPAGGAPTPDAPTGPVVLVGQLGG